MLYRYLPFETYLRILSKMYFISFNYGFLRGNRLFAYPYFLKNIVKNGDVCIDIGANLGYLTKVFSKLVGKNGKVYSIEPVKPVRSVLEKNTKCLKNVEILPYALGEENKPIRIENNTFQEKGFVATGSFFVSDKKATQASKSDSEFDAMMKKGSELFNHLQRLDFIKVDIEGYEIVVIPEIEPIIMKFKPMLLIETDGDNRKKLLQFFKVRNYRGYVLNEGVLYPAKEDESWDILFVPEEKSDIVSKFLP